MKKMSPRALIAAIAAHGSVLLFFVVALEVMIMISPFAFFFYSVFGPVFNWLDRYAATAWLTAFFLPHMILPPTLLLKVIRISGSVFFVAGAACFVVCAVQVYLGKFFKWGIARWGMYRVIRHPQYVSLAIWGIGMAILWPRFIVLLSLSIMFVLYYYLAGDEERRMLAAHGASYADYMSRTGMFLPRYVERFLPRVGWIFGKSRWRYVAVPVLSAAGVIGTGFLGREITLRSLSFASAANVSLVSILPEDSRLSGTILQVVTGNHRDRTLEVIKSDRDYLGYVMPPDYIMQGIIANTGSDFHLFKQHNTVAMITDWVFHPFEHLRRSPAAHMAQMHNVDPATARRHHCPLGKDDENLDCANCPYRRVIFVEIEGDDHQHCTGSATLAIRAERVPVAYMDINTVTGEIFVFKSVESWSAWVGVPTPVI